MIGIDRLIIVGTDGNLYEFIHGPENTKGWSSCCFKGSTSACEVGECTHEECARIRGIFCEPEVWSWRILCKRES